MDKKMEDRIPLHYNCESCHDGPWWDRPITNIIATFPECPECDEFYSKWKERNELSKKEAIKVLKAKGGRAGTISLLKRWKNDIQTSS